MHGLDVVGVRSGRDIGTTRRGEEVGWIEWAFSGVGAALLVFLLGLFGTKAVRRRTSVRQSQKAGDNAAQVQSGRDTKIDS